MSGEMVRAVMGWRWMPGRPDVQQSFIVRVPEEKLDAELAWHRANTPWPELPRPSIVVVPAEADPLGDVVDRARQFTDAFAEPGNVWRMEARQLILELAAEVDRAREFVDQARSLAAGKAIAAHALGQGDVERGWLDLSALIERLEASR